MASHPDAAHAAAPRRSARALTARGAALAAGLASVALASVALASVALVSVVLAAGRLAPSASAATIPEGTALWYACTEPSFSGPPSLRCPQPYDPRYVQTFLHGFSRFTPENEFKMVYLEPQQYRFNFAVADQIAAFARDHGKTIRGHTLIWSHQLPWWLTHPLLAFSRRAMAYVMYTYVTHVVSHFATRFPGVVTEWDVVNEPLTSSGRLAWSPWAAAIGPDYIRTALDYAHAADPNAQLVINDNGADDGGPKEAAMLSLATQLKRSGAPLDAVGFEAHVTPDTAPSLAGLLWLYHQYALAGLKVEITELDVSNDGGVDDPAAKLDVFRRYALACRLSGNCAGLTVWGVSDRYSWLGAAARALLYDADFGPSPAVGAIRDALDGEPALPAVPAAAPAPVHPAVRHARTRRTVRTIRRRNVRTIHRGGAVTASKPH